MSSPGPLLVFGPRSTTYDFGPGHPLTPLRFGPGIDLLASVGAEPGLAPEPATDAELSLCHDPAYIAAVRRLSLDPDGPPAAGIGRNGDDPPFGGMHEAAAAVAGGSMAAMRAILAGDVEHAFHPGGGLHHAMRDHASGFCIYDDPALAIAVARQAGKRVLYVDLDVHHGDGVEALHAADPDVLTVSIHESGRSLFPGTGFVGQAPQGAAPGSVINVPLEAFTGAEAWLEAVEAVVTLTAERFRPDVVVSQHGADTPRLGPARSPAGDDHGDGGCGPSRRWHRSSLCRRSMAGHRWRWLRRVSGGAADVGPRVAGRGAPARALIDPGGMAGALVRCGRGIRHAGTCPRRSRTRRRSERRPMPCSAPPMPHPAEPSRKSWH